MTNVQNLDPFMGLLEMENIITVQADAWNDKIIAAKTLAIEFLNSASDQDIIVLAKDLPFANKLAATFTGYTNVKINNTHTDMGTFSNLSNVYGIIVVDSGLFNDHTKFLVAKAAQKGKCRLAFVV